MKKVLFILFGLALFLRTMYVSQGSFMFAYDQARDAYIVGDLLKGDLKIQGPPTSTREFFHGVLYYYVLAPGYWLGKGSPIVAATWLALVSSLGVFLIYGLARQLGFSKFWSAIAVLLFAVSYEQIQYATYLANTGLAVLTVPLLYMGLFKWFDSKKSGPILTGLGLGLSFQANFIFIYHLVVVVAAAGFRKISINRSSLLRLGLFFLLAASTMFISEIKFGFPSRGGPASLLHRSNYATMGVNLNIIFHTAMYQFQRLVGLNLYPQKTQFAVWLFILSIGAIVLLRKMPRWWPVALLALASFMPPLVVGGISTPYIHAGLGSLVIIISVYMLQLLPKWLFPIAVVVISVIVISNLNYVKNYNQIGAAEFAIQRSMNVKNEMAAMDYMYSEAKGKSFSINSITAPLNVNTAWSYLFNWYGKSKYGYVPHWHGSDQSGQLGNNLTRPDETIRYFLIIEPSQGIPVDLINQSINQENKNSNFNHQAVFGEIIVQNRTRKL